MQRTDYYTLTFLVLFILGFVSIGMSTLYESYLEGRIIYNAVAQNSSVMIGNNTCFTSIWDDTINFTCNGTLTGHIYIPDLTIGQLEYNKSYCSLWAYNETGAIQTFATQMVYYNMTQLVNHSCAGLIANHTGYDKIIIDKTGQYSISFSVAFNGGLNGEYGFGVAKNGNIQRNCYGQITGTNGHQDVGVTCYLSLNKGDIINMQVDDEANPTQSIQIHTIQLSTHRIGSLW